MGTTAPAVSAMSKEVFHATKEFLALTEKQRVWVDTFIETQDAAVSTEAAYGVRGTPYAAMLTKKVASSRVLAALDVFYGRSPRERFLRDLEDDIRRSSGIARFESRRLYAKIVGLIDGAPSDIADVSAPKHRFNVGDICIQDGQKYRVTSIDASGQPLTADEVTL